MVLSKTGIIYRIRWSDLVKRKKKIIIGCILVIFITFLSCSTYVSFKVYGIVRSSYINYGMYNPNSDMVPDEIYRRMSYRARHVDLGA